MTELVIQLSRNFQYLRLSKIFLFICILLLLINDKTREILVNSSSDAFIAVSSFVGMTLLIFTFLEKKNFNLQKLILNNRRFEIPICSFLGSIPGCGGAIMVMSLFTRGIVSFGAVLAALISTMGDAAFLLIAVKPEAALIILPVTFIVGIISGYIAQPFTKNFLKEKINKSISISDLPKNKTSNKFYKLWFFILIPGLILGLINAFNIDANFEIFGMDVVLVFSFSAALFCVLLWVLNPLTDIQMASIHENSYRRVVDTTCFVTVWVIISFVLYELINLSTNGAIFESLILFGPFLPLIAILIGFIPGCGPQIMITSMYVSGQIPMSAQIGNSISNDGDALFPAIAISAKAAIVATLYSAIPAIIIAYLWHYIIG
ncbi:MAG: manganese transporter [alpha proteobacterium HIMB59]|nr:MAG: manganese transporter [alpha proteobacterium HIMB59]